MLSKAFQPRGELLSPDDLSAGIGGSTQGRYRVGSLTRSHDRFVAIPPRLSLKASGRMVRRRLAANIDHDSEGFGVAEDRDSATVAVVGRKDHDSHRIPRGGRCGPLRMSEADRSRT